MIATVTLNPSIDYIVKAESLLPGGITRTREESVYPGGKGINVSVMLAGLGQESCAFGFTAGFTGEKIEGDLRAFGCRTAMIELKEGFSRINVKIHAQEESEINGHGPVITQEDVGRLLERLDGLKEGDWLVLAGSIPPGLPRNLYGQILARMQGRGIGCIVDAEGEALRCTLSGHPFLIKPNRHELSQLCGKELRRERFETLDKRCAIAVTDCLFMTSRDGINWKRYNDAFLRPGPESGRNWCYGDVYLSSGLVETASPYRGCDNEISMYCGENRWMGLPGEIYRYTMRLDGFVSQNAAWDSPWDSPALVTKKFIYEGKDLFINFATSAYGHMTITLRADDGRSIYTGEIFGDSTNRHVVFENGSPADFEGQPVVMEIKMRDADIYSFKFE